MATRRSAFLGALLAGTLVGIGVPLLELRQDCLIRDSEACVWGRALLPVSLGVGAMLGAVVGVVAYHVVRAWRRS